MYLVHTMFIIYMLLLYIRDVFVTLFRFLLSNLKSIITFSFQYPFMIAPHCRSLTHMIPTIADVGFPGVLQLEAKGFRNPFRLVVAPESGDVIIGDVGLDSAESLKVVPNPLKTAATASMPNYGWPCIEGDSWIPPYAAQ